MSREELLHLSESEGTSRTMNFQLSIQLISVNQSKPVTSRRRLGTPTDASAVMVAHLRTPVLCNA